MEYKVIQAPRHLAGYIRFFWFAVADPSCFTPYTHRAFAYHCPEIVFCYKGQFNYSVENEQARKLVSGIYGQTQRYSKVSADAAFGVFGFYLYPHALPYLFGMPANELTNQLADIKTFCGNEGVVLEEKVMSAENNEERINIVCRFIEKRVRHLKQEDHAILTSIKAISKSSAIISVRDFAEKHFLSVRQFERRFKVCSGFNPKLFLRLARFNAVINSSLPATSLVKIAYECGYYDQSHFIHDFKTFSGYSPREYFKLDTVAASDRGTVEFTIG